MPLSELPGYVGRVPILADINLRYLGMSDEDFSEWLVGDLERSGAVRRNDGMLYASGN